MEEISSNRETKIVIRNVLTAIVSAYTLMSLFVWLVVGTLHIGVIIVWGVWLLFCGGMFWVFLYSLLDALKKEIPYPWNMLVMLVGGFILMYVSLFVIEPLID
jgi:hypothetical protein